MSQFIGRGEETVESILQQLFHLNARTFSQYPIRGIVTELDEFGSLSDEVKKHKFDFYVRRDNKQSLIIEVNYKHGDKADKKWNNIFVPLIRRKDMIPVTIDDFSCESLFKDMYHPITLGDWRDVLQALIHAEVEL